MAGKECVWRSEFRRGIREARGPGQDHVRLADLLRTLAFTLNRMGSHAEF